jgi:hypothetical protein
MAEQIIVIPENEYFIVQDVSGGGAGNDGRGITDAEIIGTDLVLSFTSAPSPVNVGRVVGEDGTNGTNGTNGNDGNGIVTITQPSDFVLRVETDDFTNDFELFQGPAGPSSLLEFINKQSFFDHLTPAATPTLGYAVNFQAVVRSGSGTAAFRNTHTIGGGGQITLNSGGAGASGSTDLSIRSGGGLSGIKIGATPIDYIFCFYADTLQTSGDSSVFRLCAQNNNTASLTETNRTGFYVDFAWNTDGVKATFSCFNGTGPSSFLSTVLPLDTLALTSGTLYAVRVRVSNTAAQFYINGVLRGTIQTNLPVFLPIQISVGLYRTGSGAGASYTLDAIACEATATQNLYTL